MMKTITLTDAQREDVLNALMEWRDEDRINCLVDVDGLSITIKGILYVDGYREDDYNSGTGAYIETDREASLTIRAHNEDGEEMYVDDETETACIDLLEELD